MAGEELIIDLSNYKDRVGSRVAPNRYRVQVEDAEAAESAAKNPMVNLWFRIVGGEFDGQTITDRLVLTDKSLFRVVGFMQAVGLPTPKKRLKINLRQFVGRTLDIDVEDGEPYNGRVRSEVRGYVRIPKAAAEADSGDDLESLEGNLASGPGVSAMDPTDEGQPAVTPSKPTEGGGTASTDSTTVKPGREETATPQSAGTSPQGQPTGQEDPWQVDDDAVNLDDIDL